MKIANLFRWIIRISLFILILVLVIDNIQAVQFNLFGIYNLHLPLIALTLVFFALGILFGLLINLVKTMELKSKINKLQKQLDKFTSTPPHSDAI